MNLSQLKEIAEAAIKTYGKEQLISGQKIWEFRQAFIPIRVLAMIELLEEAKILCESIENDHDNYGPNHCTDECCFHKWISKFEKEFCG